MEGNNVNISIVGVSEKDIDLLLLEEFVSSADFLDWFTDKLNLSYVRLISAARGVADSTGESDLTLKLKKTEGKIAVIHIENKISASFQPNQKERYKDRGQQQVNRGEADEFYLCLVAPECYLNPNQQHPEFNLILFYDDILEWIKASDIDDNRKVYKCSLLEKAIRKGRDGWLREEDALVNTFWKTYWKRANAIAPILQMKEPAGVPSTSSFIYFYPPKRIKGIRFVHKLDKGNAEIQIGGWERRIYELREALKDLLQSDMTIETANQSASVRIKVPVINTSKSCEDQAKAIDDGIEACLRLYRWFEMNYDCLSSLLQKKLPD